MKTDYFGKAERIILAVVIISMCFFCGCTLETEAPHNETAEPYVRSYEWCDVPYSEFDGGLTSFSTNACTLNSTVYAEFIKTDYADGLDGQKLSYYESIKTLFAMMSVDMTMIREFDFLSVNSEISDRADGILPVSQINGYRIKSYSEIGFGCSEISNSKKYELVGSLKYCDNCLLCEVKDTLSDGSAVKQKIEAVVRNETQYAIRFTVSSDASKNDITKILYIILNENKAEIGYYEGKKQSDKLILLTDLYDFNMNAVSFGVGTLISFEIEI